MPHLSKSRYLAGLQCDRRLWLDTHEPEAAAPIGDALEFIFRTGDEVGRAAHALFPGGVLVENPATDHAGALARTRALMEDASVPAVFEAAFEYEGVRIRVDVLEKLGAGRFGLREVKSSSRVKPESHYADLAIQKWVLDGNGLKIASAQLLHVDSKFTSGSRDEPIDWNRFFVRAELLSEVDALIGGGIDSHVARMHEILRQPAAPSREPGRHCKKPHLCGHWSACTANKTTAWRIEQTGASAGRKRKMIEQSESGAPWFSPDLPAALRRAEPPVWVLDFEAIGATIPLCPGTRPYQVIPFQWSLHHLDRDGSERHFEFLADGRADPRTEVARTLVEHLSGDDRRILVYSGYEKRCLEELAKYCPDLREDLHAIRDRLFDLLPIVSAHFYHRSLYGSFSIKSVAPVLAPLVDYSALGGVSDGAAAMGAFAKLVSGELSASEDARLRAELLAYCKLDTKALLETFKALRRGGG